MKSLSTTAAYTALFLLLLTSTGCAPVKTIWTCEPEAVISSNRYFQAKLTPEKQENDFFVSFLLEVQNLSETDLAVDWNSTLYIYNNQKNGLFVFEGITPKDIGDKSIPLEIIPAGSGLSKHVSPFKLLAKAPLRATGEPVGFSAGILPAGENGMLLVIRHGDETVSEFMSVSITEQVAP